MHANIAVTFDAATALQNVLASRNVLHVMHQRSACKHFLPYLLAEGLIKANNALMQLLQCED